MKKYKILLCGLTLLLSAGVCQAQYGRPYLVGAALDVAVDAEADIWLNGIHIAHCAHTPMGSGYKRIAARPDSLCYFKKDNLIAIQVKGAKGCQGDHFIGVAYAFWFKLSDGTYRVINSASIREHRCLYLRNSKADAPIGWQEEGFDDSSWALAQCSGDMIPDTATLALNQQGAMAGFLTATQGYLIQYKGEKQLFRRSFTLDVSTNPRCVPQGSLAPSNPYLSAYSQPDSLSHDGPSESITPQVLPAHQQPLKAAPQLQRPMIQPNPQWVTFNENPPAVMPTAMVHVPRALIPAPTVVLLAAQLPTPIVQNDGAIVFGTSNANILVSFADGPGFYTVEAVDASFNHLKTLLNQRVVSVSDMWLSWDGTDDAGNVVPQGRYYVLCSKEGVVLQKIILRHVSP